MPKYFLRKKIAAIGIPVKYTIEKQAVKELMTPPSESQVRARRLMNVHRIVQL